MNSSSEEAPRPSKPGSARTSAKTPECVLNARLEIAHSVLNRLFEVKSTALSLMESIKAIVAQSGCLYMCGNGGSAAQALHFSEELLGRYKRDRPAIAAVCLNADPTALTCIANDFGFERVFARQIEALSGPEDGLVVFSTSGRSPNILEALKTAARQGTKTIGFLGGDGGPALPLCDEAVVIQGDDTAAIQEAHQTLLHACCELLEHS